MMLKFWYTICIFKDVLLLFPLNSVVGFYVESFLLKWSQIQRVKVQRFKFQGNPSKNKQFRLLSRAGFSCGCFLHHKNPFKCIGPDALHLRVLRELAFMRLVPIKFESSQRLGEVPKNWRMANLPPVFTRCWNDAQRNYRLVRLTLVSGKVIGQLLSAYFGAHER